MKWLKVVKVLRATGKVKRAWRTPSVDSPEARTIQVCLNPQQAVLDGLGKAADAIINSTRGKS